MFHKKKSMLHLHEEVFWVNQKRLILQNCKGNAIAFTGHMTWHLMY